MKSGLYGRQVNTKYSFITYINPHTDRKCFMTTLVRTAFIYL